MSLKLGPIPDRTAVKLSFFLPPEVHDALSDYAALHAKEFGREAPLSDLAALMIEKFLESDPQFRRHRKSLRSSAAVKE